MKEIPAYDSMKQKAQKEIDSHENEAFDLLKREGTIEIKLKYVFDPDENSDRDFIFQMEHDLPEEYFSIAYFVTRAGDMLLNALGVDLFNQMDMIHQFEVVMTEQEKHLNEVENNED